MIPRRIDNYFPSQRVSNSEKEKPEWYANSIDFIIDAGLSCNDRTELIKEINILHGNIPDEMYRKTLNPYNSSNEKYTRFPATMRNLDIMKDIVRRYVSEYIKGVHDFTVGANNPEIVINKKVKLRELVSELAQQAFAKEFQNNLAALQQQAAQNGQDPSQINPQEAMPDPEEFLKKFEEDYIDEESKKAQDVLDYIRAVTEDELTYSKAYFDYVSFGECYDYTEIVGDKIVKQFVPVVEAYPIPNSEFFVEDHDMFARRLRLTYQQILDKFDEYLTPKDRSFLDTYYNRISTTEEVKLLGYNQFFETYPDICEKFNKEERDLFRKEKINVYDGTSGLYDVWHVVWRGDAKIGILTYLNNVGFESKMIVEEGFKFDKSLGHISIEWKYVPQVYEGYRIGTRYTSIYPIKARAIAYNRNGKLPYNGLIEVLPQFGKFSIVKIVTPFQILRNIIAYHREMVIAKNKMLILIMPESLLGGDEAEDKIYKMAADGVMYYDDSEDTNSLKAQQIRLLNANLGNYITELTSLMDSIKNEARELVDMTPQRYGEIANSAGMGTTREAINRGSMGSVIITFVFDKFRERSYNRDLDYAKLAFVDGVNESFTDGSYKRRYLSLDANSLTNLDLSTTCRNNAKELEKLEQLRQWAFSAAQNGDLDLALAAITAENVAGTKKVINDFMNIKRQHEEQMKQAEQMIEQAKIQSKLQEIAAKGEEDRKTEELRYYYEMQLKYIDVTSNLATTENSTSDDKNRAVESIEASKREIEKQKLDLERMKVQADIYSKAADRNVKREDIKTKLEIAKTNKNKYDKK